MRIGYLFGIIFFLFSCKEAPVVVSSLDEEIPVVEAADYAPPIIRWISPRFDAVVKEIINIECQIIDTSGVAFVELFVDSLLSGINSNSTSDSTFEFSFDTSNFDDGSEPKLYIHASDKMDNDTVSQIIRLIVDNSHSYPSSVNLYGIDSIFDITNTIFNGYKLKWEPSIDSYFAQYILQKSDDPLFINPHIIFTTSNESINEFEDNNINSESFIYYRIVVEDIFEKKTPGNVISTSMSSMPQAWDIQSVIYTDNSLSISWSNPPVINYLSHQLLFSDKRDGTFEEIQSFSDSSITQYEPLEFIPNVENWFSINVFDTLGQISMSQPHMHPNPNEPVIDSVLYNDHTFTINWAADLDADFSEYKVLQSRNENPYDFITIKSIVNSSETLLTISDIIESRYYLYQIITKDAWGLETRGRVIKASSFYKFVKKVGGYENDILNAIIPREDGGYLAVGSSFNKGSWLLLISSLGEVEDSLYFSETYSEFNNIVHLANGGNILTGYYRNGEKENILVIKTDDAGNQEWKFNSNSFNDNIRGNAAVGLTDGSIGITGYSNNNNNNQDIFVLKLDATGSEKWTRTIVGDQSDKGHDILALEDGGMIILGETHSNGDDDSDIWLIKFDSEGNSVDTLLVSIEGRQVGYSFVKTDLDEYVIGGITSGNSGVTDAFIIKVNELGEVVWDYSFGGNYNDSGVSVIYSDGGWVLVGQTYSYDVGMGDILLIKVNDFGELEWMKTIGGNMQDSALDIQLALDGGFIISGITYSDYNKDGWIIKTDSRGNYKGMFEYP